MDDDQVKQKMQQVLQVVVSDLSNIRGGHATPALVEDLAVMVYGGQQKLKIQELATITSPDHQTIVIDPWDKSIIGEIRQGILSANIGLNPSIDGNVLRISIPPMTTEDREKFVKLLSGKVENGRVSIRQVRGDFMHDIKKKFEDKELSEDEKFAAEKRLQEVTDEFISKIEDVGSKKKDDIVKL